MDREVIAACGRLCEDALRAEVEARELGWACVVDYARADAEQYSRIAFAESRA